MLFLALVFLLPISGFSEPVAGTPEEARRTLLKTAQELYERGEYSGARSYYERYLKDNPKDPKLQAVLMMIAECALESARLSAASDDTLGRNLYLDNRLTSLYSRVIDVNSDNYLADGAQFRINEIYYNAGAYPEAAKAWDKFVENRDRSYLRGEALKAQAHTLAAEGRWEEMGAALDELARHNPAYEDTTPVQYLRGALAFYRKDYSAATGFFQKISTPTPAGLYYLGQSYLAQGRALYGAQKFQELMRLFPGTPLAEEAEFLVAESNFAAQDYPAAIASFDQFLQTYSTSAYRWAAHYKVGYSQFAMENYIAARESLQIVLGGATNKDQTEAGAAAPAQPQEFSTMNLSLANEFAPWALYLVGETYLQEKRYREASFVYGKMANAFPRHTFAANALYKLSWCLAQDQDFAAAQTNLLQLLTLYPVSPVLPYAHFLLGNIFFSQGKFDEAARAYQRSVDISFPQETGEAAMALAQQANYQAKNYGGLISGYHLILNNFPPTANLWRAWTYLYVAEGYFQSGHYAEAKEAYQTILRLYPASPASIHAQDGMAWSLFKLGRYGEAVKERERLAHLRDDPNVPQELMTRNDYELGNAFFNLKKYSQALEQYERFAQDHSTHPLAAEALYRAGLSYAQLGYHGQSIETWQKLRKQFSGTEAATGAAKKAADTYFRAAKYDDAIALYQEIASAAQGPEAAQARLRIAQSYYNSQRHAQAFEAFQTLIVKHQESPEAKEALDFLTALMEKPDLRRQAQNQLDGIVSQLNHHGASGAELRFRIAQSHFDAGDFALASMNLEKLAGVYLPETRMADKEYFLGESYYQTGKLKESVSVFERMVKNFPADERAAFALFRAGNAQFKLEKFSECGVMFERLIRDFPKSDYVTGAHYNAALCYRKAKLWSTAENLFASYIDRYPAKAKETGARQELADLFQEQKKYRDALAQLEALRKETPGPNQRFAEITFQMASLNLLDGNEAGAAQEYEKMISTLPSKDAWRINAAIKLGDLYEKTDQTQKAIQTYELIVRDAGKPEWVNAAKARIEYLRSQK